MQTWYWQTLEKSSCHTGISGRRLPMESAEGYRFSSSVTHVFVNGTLAVKDNRIIENLL